jgi:hypothetical protein
MTTRRAAACCGVGSPSGYAVADRKQGDRAGQSRGPTWWGCDFGAECCVPFNVAGIPYTGRSRFAGPSSNASGRPRTAGMRPSAIADSRRHSGIKVNHLKDDEANA